MATAKMDLEKLTQSVKSGRYALKQHDSKKSKSKCWETFRDIIDDGDNLLFGVVCCCLCYALSFTKIQDGGKVIVKYFSSGSGHRVKCYRVGSGTGSVSLTRFHLWPKVPTPD